MPPARGLPHAARLAIIAAGCWPIRRAGGRAAYRAAFVEYSPLGHYVRGEPTKQRSLRDYEKAARRAESEGAQIIVFPEYGITGYSNDDASTWHSSGFSEMIPSPAGDTPCSETQRYEHAPSIVRLSCIAKHFSIAVVANLMDFEDTGSGAKVYNTDVAFDTDGRFLSKYRKLNRWGEQFTSVDETCQPASFTTSFGVTFGMMTCADIIWEHPGMDLIRDGVYDFVLPVGWDNTYAQFQVLPYVQGWSHVHGVNVIVSNGHTGPPGHGGESGSGVFASGVVLDDYYYPDSSRVPIVRVADVPAARGEPLATVGAGKACPQRAAAPSASYWRFAPLPASGRLCAGAVCCEADALEGGTEGFVLAALDGVDQGPGGISGAWPAQACAVLPCTSTDEGCLHYQEPTGKLTKVRLRMTGAEFCASHPVAQVLASGPWESGFSSQRLLQPGDGGAGGTFRLESDDSGSWLFPNVTTSTLLASLDAETMTLSSVSIYVRRFDLDGPYLPYACHHPEATLLA